VGFGGTCGDIRVRRLGGLVNVGQVDRSGGGEGW
jgi:hypothetical protein